MAEKKHCKKCNAAMKYEDYDKGLNRDQSRRRKEMGYPKAAWICSSHRLLHPMIHVKY